MPLVKSRSLVPLVASSDPLGVGRCGRTVLVERNRA